MKVKIEGSDFMPVLLAILQWVLLSSAMACVLIAVILLAKFIFKNKIGASWHYYIWFLLLLRLLVPFTPGSQTSIFNLIVPVFNSTSTQIDKFTGVESNPINKINSSMNQKVTQDKPQSYHDKLGSKSPTNNEQSYVEKYNWNIDMKLLLLVLWLAGVIVFCFLIFFKNIEFYLRIREHSNQNNQTINQLLNECMTTMNIKRKVTIIFSKSVNTPCIYGVIKPKLLISDDLQKKISNDELKYIFYHELAHLKRNDVFILWVTVILKIIHWFNPMIWYGFYKMHQDCEVASDFLALSYMKPEERNKYGYTIINLLGIISRSKWIPGTTGIMGGKSQMKRRIKMISIFKKVSIPSTVAAIVLIIAIGAVCLTNSIKVSDTQPTKMIATEKDPDNTYSEKAGDMQPAKIITTDEKPAIRMTNKYSEFDNKNTLLQEYMKSGRMFPGTMDVTINGIIITIVNKPTEIQRIVNELVGAGATAIAVNDERLIETSKIKVMNDKKAVVINGNEYRAPYAIKAIGNTGMFDYETLKSENLLDILNLDISGERAEKYQDVYIQRYNINSDVMYSPPVLKYPLVGLVLPHLEITDRNNRIGWIRGDANFTGAPGVILGNTAFGADENSARQLEANSVKIQELIKFKADEVKGLFKPKYRVQQLGEGNKLSPYPSTGNLMLTPKKEGEYIFLLEVDWGATEKNNLNIIYYWFKLKVKK